MNLSIREAWQQLSEAENRHDTSGHAELLAADVVVHMPGGVDLAGRDAYVAMIESMFRGIPDYSAELLHVAAADDVVVVHWTITGTHDGELFGIPATARKLQYRGCSVWRGTRGRITEGWLYPDRATMLAQLGVE